MINVHNVIVLFELFDEKIHKLDIIFALESNGCGCLLGLVCGKDLVACCSEIFLNAVNIVGFGGDDENIPLCLEVCSACFESLLHQLIFVNVAVLVIDNDLTDVGKEVANATGLTHVAVVFGEVGAHVTCGTVAVVGGCGYDNGNTCGTVALIRNFFIVLATAAKRLFNTTLNVIVGNVVCLCFLDQVAQLGVVIGISAALFNCDGDLFADLGKDLTLCGIGLFFFVLDIRPFAMSGHNDSSFRYIRYNY